MMVARDKVSTGAAGEGVSSAPSDATIISYDVALSFASEDREYVDAVATRLHAMGFTVFYDAFHVATTWGHVNRDVLGRVFREGAGHVVAFISRHYVGKPWTMFELNAAMEGEASRTVPSLLPVRFDSTAVPGLPPEKFWIEAAAIPPDQLALHIRNRVARQPHLREARMIPPKTPGAPRGDSVQCQASGQTVLALDLRKWGWTRNIDFGDSRYPYGNVLHNAYPGFEMDNVVEYDVEIVEPGEYMLAAEYAARICRPTRVFMNGLLVNGSGMELTTGGWEEVFQQTHDQGLVYLSAGRYNLRLERDSFFPHVRALMLVGRQGG